MRYPLKIFCASSLALAVLLATALLPAASARAQEVEPDPETHRVVGGLYALAAAVNLHGGKDLPTPSHLRGHFAETAADWLTTVQVQAADGAWWVGVQVGRYSSARRFLRAHAPELGILDRPGGRHWMGGDSAWMKAADVTGQGDKVVTKGIPLRAAQGKDQNGEKDVLFLGAPGSELWWQAMPSLTSKAAKAVLKRWGTEVSGLRAPAEAEATSEKFRASPVGLPQEIHLGAGSDDFSVEMGDMIFNPIPRMKEN